MAANGTPKVAPEAAPVPAMPVDTQQNHADGPKIPYLVIINLIKIGMSTQQGGALWAGFLMGRDLDPMNTVLHVNAIDAVAVPGQPQQ
jgi:hypothetical protein